MITVDALAQQAARSLELFEVQRERIVVHRRWSWLWLIGALLIEIAGGLALFS